MVIARKLSPARLLTYSKQVVALGFVAFVLWMTFRHAAGPGTGREYYSLGPLSQGQELINYLGKNLVVTYKSLDNRNGFLSEITIKNNGLRDVIGSEWSIYLNHFQYIDTDRFNSHNGHPEGVEEPGQQRVMPQFLLQHVMGNLFLLQPTAHFGNLTIGKKISLYITGGAPMSARQYMMPNWYVIGPDTAPSVIQCTADDELEFVQDYREPAQWKTSRDDGYHPYSPEDRYKHNEVRDYGSAPRRIIPTPIRIIENPDQKHVTIDWSTWTIVHSDETVREAEYLQSVVGGRLSTESPGKQFVSVKVGFISIPKTKSLALEEAYTLEVNADLNKVEIIGTTPKGAFYGVISLLALLDAKSQVPVVQVADAPRLPYRGIMVDVVRNFHGKETLMKMLDGLTMFKMNVLHIHIADDEGWRLQIPGLEELTQVGSYRCHDYTEKKCLYPALGSGPFTNSSGSGHFSVEDYRQLLQYASRRHIEIIPEFDMPGHSRAAIKSMEARYHKLRKEGRFSDAERYLLSDLKDSSNYLSGQFFRNNAINPCIESSYTFVDHVIREVIAMHKDIMPLKRFNFGGDEVPQDAFIGSPSCMALMKKHPELSSSRALKTHFVRRVSKIAAAHNLGVQGWEDAFEDVNNQPYSLVGLGVPEAYTHSWYNIWEGGLAHRAHEYANAGYKVILSHVTHLYFDAPQEPDPEERGLYWATRYIDMKRVFYYTPDSIFDNVDFGYYGQKLDKNQACSQFINCMRLMNPENIVGMQGQAWSETMRSQTHLSEMLFPRTISLAERSWHRSDWEALDPELKQQQRRLDWQDFANNLGYRELSRLEKLGIPYYVPPPGAKYENGDLLVNSPLPGLVVQYSADGTVWNDCTTTCPVSYQSGKLIYLSTKSADGTRRSRSISYRFT